MAPPDEDGFTPTGPERRVHHHGGATIGGAPVAYVVVLATVVTALAFIPFTIVLGSGGSFPLSQGVYPLLGWLLGPSAGALGAGVGTTIGVFLAPHTAGVPLVSIWSAAMGGFAAGAMSRRALWPWVFAVGALELAFYLGRALGTNHIPLGVALAGSLVDWSGLLLYLLPTRALCVRLIADPRLGRVGLGVALGTWMVSGISHVSSAAITYVMFNWPEKVWITLVPIIPFENLARCLVGAAIGTGVIAGLRAIGLVRPEGAVY